MFFCILLAVMLLLLLIINFYLFKKDIMEPAIIFNGSFFVSSFFLIFAALKWNKDINILTVSVIVFSVTIFSFLCYYIKTFIQKINIDKKNINNNKSSVKNKKEIEQNHEIKIKSIYLVLFLIFSLIIIILTIYYTVRAVDGSFNHIGAALYKYRNYTLRYKYDVNIPYIIDMLGGIVHAMSYYFLYVLINNLIVTKKVNILLIIVTIVASLSTVLDGTRGAIINILLSVIPMFFILMHKHKGKVMILNRKIVLIILISGIIFLTQFKRTAVLLGRNDAKVYSSTDYINIYLGAPIYNFDSFLKIGHPKEKYFGIHTFSSIYDTFGNYESVNKQQFRKLEKYDLGNVYTIFFDFICDGGYIGLILGVVIMSLICQFIYEKILLNIRNKILLNKPDVLIIVFCYIFGGIIFSFFGNKFYNQIFNLGFIKYIVLWYCCNIFLFGKWVNNR